MCAEYEKACTCTDVPIFPDPTASRETIFVTNAEVNFYADIQVPCQDGRGAARKPTDSDMVKANSKIEEFAQDEEAFFEAFFMAFRKVCGSHARRSTIDSKSPRNAHTVSVLLEMAAAAWEYRPRPLGIAPSRWPQRQACGRALGRSCGLS